MELNETFKESLNLFKPAEASIAVEYHNIFLCKVSKCKHIQDKTDLQCQSASILAPRAIPICVRSCYHSYNLGAAWQSKRESFFKIIITGILVR